GEALPGDAMERERDRVDGAPDLVGAGTRGLERRGEGIPGGALAEDADGQAARLGELGDELARTVRLKRAGRVVEDDARGAELGELAGLLDELVGLARLPGAVDEP